MTPRRLVLDTDVGTDVDDLLTLAMIPALAAAGEVALEAVTLVYGDTDLRCRITSVACAGMGLDVPIHRGIDTPFSGKDIMWPGHEGQGIDGLDSATYDDAPAVPVLVERAAIDPGSLHIVAIGPLTNIAAAIMSDPDFAANVAHLTIMGGEFEKGWPEHNFTADAVATWIVMQSGIPMTITPLDQTLRVLLRIPELDRIAAGHPIGPLLADQARRFWAWLATFVPEEHRNANAPHDLMALLTLVQPELFEFANVDVGIAGVGDRAGHVTATPNAASTTRIVVDHDPAAVLDALLELLAP